MNSHFTNSLSTDDLKGLLEAHGVHLSDCDLVASAHDQTFFHKSGELRPEIVSWCVNEGIEPAVTLHAPYIQEEQGPILLAMITFKTPNNHLYFKLRWM
jgi:hypothetical protein